MKQIEVNSEAWLSLILEISENYSDGSLISHKWLKKKWYIYVKEYYTPIKKNEMLPFAATWMDLEGIMLSETSQTQKDKEYMIPPM